MRFGIEYVEAALAAQGRKLLVIDPDEMKNDIVRDLHEVIVSLCARLYGKRSAKNRAKRAIEAATGEPMVPSRYLVKIKGSYNGR
jgi:putative resolvase